MILYIYSNKDRIKQEYSNNAGVLDRLSVFNDNAASIYFQLNTLNKWWNKMKMNPYKIHPPLEQQYNLLVSLERSIMFCDNVIKDMQLYGFH
jgi:hypothetical protein